MRIFNFAGDRKSRTVIGLCIGIAWFLLGRTVAHTASDAKIQPGLYSILTKNLQGKSQTLEPYLGKVLLIVNTASQCGYTPQYAGLEKLYENYRQQGFYVLGFPSNDFGAQEPGSSKEIRFFCKSNYSVDFPMFEKGAVSGSEAQPLFRWLLAHSPSDAQIAWNFEKFLIGRDGAVLSRFKSDVTPESAQIVSAINRALAVQLDRR